MARSALTASGKRSSEWEKAAGPRSPNGPDSDPLLATKGPYPEDVGVHVSEVLPRLDSLEWGPPGTWEEEGTTIFPQLQETPALLT